jgi:hypothetical protein
MIAIPSATSSKEATRAKLVQEIAGASLNNRSSCAGEITAGLLLLSSKADVIQD